MHYIYIYIYVDRFCTYECTLANGDSTEVLKPDELAAPPAALQSASAAAQKVFDAAALCLCGDVGKVRSLKTLRAASSNRCLNP